MQRSRSCLKGFVACRAHWLNDEFYAPVNRRGMRTDTNRVVIWKISVEENPSEHHSFLTRGPAQYSIARTVGRGSV